MELIGVAWAGVVAQPETVIVPLTAAPGVGASIATIGGAPTLTNTVADPIFGGTVPSVANAVSKCIPGVSEAVFRE
jgi:hypothetical protein